MTEVIHLRCDHCGDEASSEDDLHRPKGWAYISCDLVHFHYCPRCWRNHYIAHHVEEDDAPP